MSHSQKEKKQQQQKSKLNNFLKCRLAPYLFAISFYDNKPIHGKYQSLLEMLKK